MVDYTLKDLFYRQNVDKQFIITTDDGTVTITNTELHQESFELTESLCSESELTFGACEAAVVKFTMSNVFISLKDKWITVKIILDGNSDNPFILGRYKVVSDKPTADRIKREIEAYDALYDVINADVVDWYNSILPTTDTYITFKAFRDSFFAHFGIAQKEITLVNDTMTVSRTADADEFSGGQVLNAICEINGCLGHIGRSGQFEFIYIDSTSPITISKNNYISADYQDYIVAQIDKLQIRQDENDIGAIAGTGSNTYVIENNFLVYGKDAATLKAVATNIFNKVKGITYRPAEITSPGNPCIEVGDAIKLSSKYAEISTYVLERTLKGIQALTDSFTAQGEQLRTTQINSSNKSITQLKGRVNRLIRDVDQNKAEISNVEEGLKNEITQTASELDVKIQNLQSQVDGEIEVVNGHGQPTLYNYPAYNWTASPKIGDTLVKGLCFAYSDETYRKHQRTLFYDENEAVTYRFIQKNDIWLWEPLANTEFSVLQKQITDLSVTAQGITADVQSLSTTITNDYITKVDAQASIKLSADGLKEDFNKTISNYSTTEQMNTAITSSAEGVKVDISKKYATQDKVNELETSVSLTAEGLGAKVSKDSLITEINASAEGVLISSSKLDLQGLVTISALQGSGQTVINADNLTTGKIKALTIEGCTITGSAVAFVNESGGWNTIFNAEGMWIIGTGTTEVPDFKIDKLGFLHLGGNLRMNPAGIWWTNNAGQEMFKAWSSFFGF